MTESGLNRIEVKSTHLARWFAPDAPLVGVLSKVILMLGFGLVVVATLCGAPGAASAAVEGVMPGDTAHATPDQIVGVTPGDEAPTLNDGAPAPDDEPLVMVPQPLLMSSQPLELAARFLALTLEPLVVMLQPLVTF